MKILLTLETLLFMIISLTKDCLTVPLNVHRPCPDLRCSTLITVPKPCKLLPDFFFHHGKMCVSCPKLKCEPRYGHFKDSLSDKLKDILSSRKTLRRSNPALSDDRKRLRQRQSKRFRNDKAFGIRGKFSLYLSNFRERDSDEVVL